MSSHTFYGVKRVGRTYAVRRVEFAIDSAGRHTGSVRIVARHDHAVEAEHDARTRQQMISPAQPEQVKDRSA